MTRSAIRWSMRWTIPWSWAVVASFAAGCTWVKLTDAGAAVAQGTRDQVADCRMIGKVSATTRDRVVVERNRDKISEELVVLARNEAANLGANVIVPVAPQRDGTQDFDAFGCGN